MSFEVFRRHQKKMLATFAILAMFGFVVSDSLPKLLNSNTGVRDQEIATIYGKRVYRSGLNEMVEERTRANIFVSELLLYLSRSPFGFSRTPFGGVKDRDMVDALILQHEADRLGIPAGPEVGREWLKKASNDRMTRALFEGLLGRFNNRVSGEQVLADIANQVRLSRVEALIGFPVVTPYDVFRAYRDQNERVSAKIVEVPVEKFLASVPEPATEEIQAEYQEYKDVLPNPSRDTPGFRVPRRIEVEILSIDGNALARGLKDKLTESELKAAYEARKSGFQIHPEAGDLPTDLFAGQPELTPPIISPFAEVRNTLAVTLAEEKAQAEIVEKFAKIKDDVLIPFADQYATALDDNEEAKKQGMPPKPLPKPMDLKDVAQREGLQYDLTPLLSRRDAEQHGLISDAEVGMTRHSGGRKFADEFFDSKTQLFEPEELTDDLNTRFLARKMQDNPPYVPSLDEVRKDVVLAWKMSRARPLAEKAAQALAEKLQKKTVAIKDGPLEGYRVVTIPPITRRQTNFMASQSETGVPEETPIPDVPYPGDPFRNAYFGLKTGAAAVAPDQPKTVYYVMTLERREPATFASLYAVNGDEFRYKYSTQREAARRLEENWLGWLRKQAGLKPDWIPPDEAKSKSAAEGT
jgi:hypothetical protein